MKNRTTNDLVIQFMKEKGIDEVKLGASIGKDPSTIYRITAKKTAPSKTTLKLIADAYGFDVSYFETGEMKEKELGKSDKCYQELEKRYLQLQGRADGLLLVIRELTGKSVRSGMATHP